MKLTKAKVRKKERESEKESEEKDDGFITLLREMKEGRKDMDSDFFSLRSQIKSCSERKTNSDIKDMVRLINHYHR